MLDIIFVAIFALVLGFGGHEGLWSNALPLVNVLLAALLATNYFEPAAALLQGSFPTWRFHVDATCFLGIFGLTMMTFRTLTDFASRVRVRFIPLADKIGGYVLAAVSGWIVVCVVCVGFHLAPVAPDFIRADPSKGAAFLMFNPDLSWLKFSFLLSDAGSLSSGELPFDAEGDFFIRYEKKRIEYKDLEGMFPRR